MQSERAGSLSGTTAVAPGADALTGRHVAIAAAVCALPWLVQRLLRLALGDEAGMLFVRERLLPEIGPVEIPTMALLALAGASATWTAVASRRRLGRGAALALLGAGLGLLAVAGEEASWGQWLFGFAPPEAIARINHQEELNLHNIVLQGKSELLRAAFGVAGLVAVLVLPRVRGLRAIAAPIAFAPMFAVLTVLPLWELVADYVVILPAIDGFMRSKLFSESQELMIAATALACAWTISRRCRARP
jgi:hypothetical protein